MNPWKRLFPAIFALGVVCLIWAIYIGHFTSPGALVVYCAHDATYSQDVLDRFTKKTGIEVVTKHDSEATKSLGLVELLVREKQAPRCDVFWNNELLGTLQLEEDGLLQPYKGTGYERIPDLHKDANGHWTGFAARARVYIVNRDRVNPINESKISELLQAGDLSRVAIAKPIYGTTLTHYAVLWDRLGEKQIKAWHAEARRKGMREVNGNSATKDLVASGACDIGFTDTDDFFVAKDAGAPVEMLPVRLQDGATICIPNTVAVIKGTNRFEDAKKLVDFLLSEENEVALANSSARQIPLGPVDESTLPAEVREMLPWLKAAAPLHNLGMARAECLNWLKGLIE